MLEQEISIRPLRDTSDLPIVRELFRAYAQSLPISLDFQNFEQELALLPHKFAEPEGCILLAYVNHQAVGVVAMWTLDDHTCEMKRLFVLPDFQKKGIGLMLAKELIYMAKFKGYQKMKLDTLARLKPAVTLYKKLGFKPCEAYNYNPESDILYFEKML